MDSLQLSFGIHRLSVVAYLMWRNKPNIFQNVGSPVVPRYETSLTVPA